MLVSIGVPQLFFGNIGRLDEKRFLRYYCNKCAKEYTGFPQIEYDYPNEEVGEGVVLVEKGEYKCKLCNNLIAQYRKFKE